MLFSKTFFFLSAALAQWLKNGENANLRRVPWVQIPDARKIRKRKMSKTTREGHRLPHSDMRWLVTYVHYVRGKRDNSNNGKDL
jgi:hypothetical protein